MLIKLKPEVCDHKISLFFSGTIWHSPHITANQRIIRIVWQAAIPSPSPLTSHVRFSVVPCEEVHEKFRVRLHALVKPPFTLLIRG